MRSRVVTPILLFFAAIGVRILSWHSVFQRDGVYPNGNDAYYHLRRIRYSVEHFPDVLDFDPLINFPVGAQPIWPPTFDWLIAALVRLLPDFGHADALERIAVWVPPVLGASTVLVVYWIGRRFFGPRAAIVAAGLMAVLPAHVIYSRLGAVDHHVMVAFVLAILLAVSMTLFREREPLRVGVGLCLSLGASMGLSVLVWPGSLLQVGLLQIGFVARMLTAPDSEGATRWARRFAIAHAAAFVVVAPFSAGRTWALWGSVSPVVLSNFQPLYFFAGFASFVLLSLLWSRGSFGATPLARVGSAVGLGAIGVLGIFLAIPALAASVGDAIAWFMKDEAFQSIVNESVPLFGGRSGSVRSVMFLGWFVYAAPLLIAFVGWRLRARAEVLLLVGWGMALFVATLVQWRFMNSYSIVHCLVIGICLDWLAGAASERPWLRERAFATTTVGVVLIGLAILPSLRSYGLHLDNLSRSLRGETTRPVGRQLHARFVADAARYLKQNSPPVEVGFEGDVGVASGGEGYSVLGPWGDGHLLKYFAERPVVQDNFGDDVAPENFRRAEAYFAASTEAEALEVVAPMRTRYVLVRSTGSGHGSRYEPASLFRRLYASKGSSVRVSAESADEGSKTLGALERHRLVYQSERIGRADPNPYCMLFEIVPGAEVVGRAEAGAIVRARLAIDPRRGPGFSYTTTTVADEKGRYRLRVPYSNEPVGPNVETESRYRLDAGSRSVTVFVPEAAVLGGERVEAPSLVD